MRYCNRHSFLAIALLFLGSGTVFAEEKLPIPADEFVYCTTCHGVQLMGNPITRAPRLSGMDAWYIRQEMQSFKKGWRGKHEGDLIGMEMQPMAAGLSDEQISKVAEFVSATRSDPPTITVSGDRENGEKLYRGCSACHGRSGGGNSALGSPALTINDDWYLVSQLKKFRNGSLGSHPDDRYGSQMRAAAKILTDDDAIMDVVSYISTLNDE